MHTPIGLRSGIVLTAGICPATLPSEVNEEDVKDTVISWANCVGVKRGALDVEFKIKDGAAVLIEINPRLAGPHFGNMIEFYTGKSIFEFVLRTWCFDEVSFNCDKAKSKNTFTEKFIFPRKSGTILAIKFPEEIPSYVKYVAALGPFPMEVEETSWAGSVVGFVIAEGETE